MTTSAWKSRRALLAMGAAAPLGMVGGLIVHLWGWELGGSLLLLLCAVVYVRPCIAALWRARSGVAVRHALSAGIMLGTAQLLVPFPPGTIEIRTPGLDRMVEPFAIENGTYEEFYGQLHERHLVGWMYVRDPGGSVSFRLSARASKRDVLKEIERQTGLIVQAGVCGTDVGWSRVRKAYGLMAISMWAPDVVENPGPCWVISESGMSTY